MLSCGASWSWQCEVVMPCAASQVFRYRILRFPAPLSVTLPPPSSTIFGPAALRTLAVAAIVIVTGSGPQENVITPPAATAATTAAEVQLPGVPSPITRVGLLVSSARASAGTAARPSGFPASATAGGELGGAVVAGVDGGAADDTVEVVGGVADPSVEDIWNDVVPHPARPRASTASMESTAARRRPNTGEPAGSAPRHASSSECSPPARDPPRPAAPSTPPRCAPARRRAPAW